MDVWLRSDWGKKPLNKHVWKGSYHSGKGVSVALDLTGTLSNAYVFFCRKIVDCWVTFHPSVHPSITVTTHPFAGPLGVDLGPRLKNQNQIPNWVFGVRPEPLTQSVWGNETQHRLSFSRSTDKVTLCGVKGDRVNVAQWVVSGAHFAPYQLNVGKNKGKIRYHSVV